MAKSKYDRLDRPLVYGYISGWDMVFNRADHDNDEAALMATLTRSYYRRAGWDIDDPPVLSLLGILNFVTFVNLADCLISEQSSNDDVEE